MKKLSPFVGLCFLLISINVHGQNSSERKADIAFVLRGFENGCFFCDSLSFDVHAKVITDQVKNLSFGRITTYEILDAGVDERSPIFLQSLRDIDVLQSALDGWPGTRWDWLRNRTDFWLVVPDEFRPIIEEAITWMTDNKQDFAHWGDSTILGMEHYWNLQSNVQRMGSSSAADFLLGLRMPEAYDPKNYGTTLVILHSDKQNQVHGGGAAATLPFFEVQDSKGENYQEQFPVAYIGATPINFSLYPIAVHEAIHTYGMGTHDKDPNGLLNGTYSIMQNASLNTLNTLPAWDRYFWTNWLSIETITTDSSKVQDLLGKVDLSDTIHKYILEVIPGDDRGRGGTYRELFDGKWYSYEVDEWGTLTFIDSIDNEHFLPVNYVLTIPETIIEGEKVIFRIFSDGIGPLTFQWKKDGEVIHSSESNELIIEMATSNDEGEYMVTISNSHGEINTYAVNVSVVCSKPPPPVITLDSEGYLVSSATDNTWYRDGVEITETDQKFIPNQSGTYTVVSTEMVCPSDPSPGFIFLLTSNLSLKSSEHILLYPNPFQDQINIDFVIDQTQLIDIAIFDLKGTKIFSKKGLSSGDVIQPWNLNNGMFRVYITLPGTESKYSQNMIKLK